jgi:hypothetical protein
VRQVGYLQRLSAAVHTLFPMNRADVTAQLLGAVTFQITTHKIHFVFTRNLYWLSVLSGAMLRNTKHAIPFQDGDRGMES